MFLLAEALLAEVLLVGVLLFGFLLVVEDETVLVVSGLQEEKGMILLDRRYWRRRRRCCSLALCLQSGTLGTFSLRLTGLGGIGSRTSGLCRCTGVLIQQ